MKRIYFQTMFTEVGILGVTLGTYTLAAHRWDGAHFGEYILSRRVISLVQLPLCLCLATSLPRFTAQAQASGAARGRSARAYLRAAVGLVTLTVVPVTLLLVLWRETVAQLVFGEAGHAANIAPVALAVAGIVAHTVAVAQARGRLAMTKANIVNFVALGPTPLLGVALAWSIPAALGIMGALWLVVAVGALLGEPRGDQPERASLAAHGEDLLRYGLPRVPGDVALVCLTSLPPIFAAHVGNVTTAGYLAFAVTILAAVGSLGGPLSTVFLPVASGELALGDWATVMQRTRVVVRIGAVGLTVVALAAAVASPLAVAIVLGSASAGAVPLLRIVALGSAPYGMYLLLRSLLDAADAWPRNARNTVLACLVFLGIAWGLATTVRDVAIGLTVALLVLGLLTAWDASRVVRGGPGALVGVGTAR